MPWSQISDTRWERPADGMEDFFIGSAQISAKISGGREHYSLLAILTLESAPPSSSSSEDFPAALRKAWTQIRHDEPHIAATVQGNKKVYEVPGEQALADWLASTLLISQASDAEELYQELPSIKQTTLYYLPKSAQLALHAHHFTFDGTGIFIFWDKLFNALLAPKDVTFGEEHARLAPTLEEVLGYPEQATEAQKDKANALFMSWAATIPGVGPVSKVGKVAPAKCRNTEFALSVETTEKLIKACKAKGITVTSAVHAAYVQVAVKHANPEGRQDKYVTSNQYNLRARLPKPYDATAASLYYSTIPWTLDLPASYWETARAVDGFNKTLFNGGNNETLDIVGPFKRILGDTVSTPEFLEFPVPTDALVSSLGILERYVKRDYGDDFRIKDLKLNCDIVAGMNTLFVYTFQDRLRLVHCFNDAYNEPEVIQTHLEDVLEILTKELLG